MNSDVVEVGSCNLRFRLSLDLTGRPILHRNCDSILEVHCVSPRALYPDVVESFLVDVEQLFAANNALDVNLGFVSEYGKLLC